MPFTILPTREGDTVLAVEYLPGQYDQRADSAVQCLQMLTMKMTAWSGRLRSSSCPVTCRTDITAIKNYCINPVEAREASFGTGHVSR